MTKEQLQDELKQLQDELKQLQGKLNKGQIKLTQLQQQLNNITVVIDFSKWIGRDGNILAIKGDRYLISYIDGDILYSNMNKNDFKNQISYRVGTLKDLKQGDVFILKYDIDVIDNIDYIKVEYFKIFTGKDDDGKYILQYIQKYLGIERITYHSINEKYYNEDEKIIIFNRN